MSKIILWAITIICFLACAYSILGVMMAASFSVVLGYSPQRATYTANFWGASTAIFFLLGVVPSVLIWRGRNRARNFKIEGRPIP